MNIAIWNSSGYLSFKRIWIGINYSQLQPQVAEMYRNAVHDITRNMWFLSIFICKGLQVNELAVYLRGRKQIWNLDYWTTLAYLRTKERRIISIKAGRKWKPWRKNYVRWEYIQLRDFILLNSKWNSKHDLRKKRLKQKRKHLKMYVRSKYQNSLKGHPM